MGDFKSLHVWKRAYAFSLQVYRLTLGFPSEERFGLTIQLRRASVSIASNIAEGCGRGGDPELCRFLRIARGSAAEVECQLLLARDLGYLTSESWRQLDEEIKRISGGIRRLLGALRSTVGTLDPGPRP
jgi:four helix bundle protein